MNWEKHYQALMSRALGRVLDGYTESHHILPRCLGGSDEADNLVRLTAREHYTAHLMLVKMHPANPKLAFAAHMMTLDIKGHRVGNRKYEWLRKRHAEALRIANKGGPGRPGVRGEHERAKMSAASLGRYKSTAHREAMSRAKHERSKTLGAYADGSARVPGVTQRKNGAFVARARSDGQRVYLGFFWSVDEARAAIEAAQ